MAILLKNETTPSNDELTLTINNGDLAAVKETVERLGLKDVESLFRYALAVLVQSATQSLTITTREGKTVSLRPSDALLKKEIATSSPVGG